MLNGRHKKTNQFCWCFVRVSMLLFLYEGDISRLGLIIPLAEMFNLILSRGTAFNRIVTHLCRTFIANKTVHSPFGVKFISIIKRRRLLQSYGVIEPNQRRGQHKQIVC